MAAEWWDPNGKFKPLHMLNPVPVWTITRRKFAGEYDRDLTQERPFEGLRILDIGCGGGLLAEPMARLGAEVVGVDAAERNIPVAQAHAIQSGLEIDYRFTTAGRHGGRWRTVRRCFEHGSGGTCRRSVWLTSPRASSF